MHVPDGADGVLRLSNTTHHVAMPVAQLSSVRDSTPQPIGGGSLHHHTECQWQRVPRLLLIILSPMRA
jgi:hypothetical protein